MDNEIRDNDIRPGEVAVAVPPPEDAGLVFIGRIHTPWTSRRAAPHQGSQDGPICRIEVFEPFVAALDGVAGMEKLQILYWLHGARRDLVRLTPGHNPENARGTFATRAPVRPNPIGVSDVVLVGIEGPNVLVRGLDCLDGTALLDIKPIHCPHA